MRVACRAVPDPVLLVHGGCGNPRGGAVRDEPSYHRALEAALEAGWAALDRGGALDGVQAAVESLEDCPLFNAGRGSVLTADGVVEMDAAVMVGSERRAGAVAAVTRVRHPVALARAVMEETRHVLIAGAGAERIAEERGLELCDPPWFVTERQHERWLASQGTVGAVALDADGRLAAATSTGGMRGQLPGRVGDSPLIGAGTYADDATCAISATGTGEAMIRTVAAHEVSALMRHRGLTLGAACATVMEQLDPLGAEAGMIAVDGAGNVALPFNTAVMHRGVMRAGSPPETGVGA
jgi:L-asparaginase / beta-aspartyl-peptidase